MSDSVSIEIKLEEGHYIETDDHIYKVREIKDDGTIKANRLDSSIREYTPEELTRVLKFSEEVKVRRSWD